MRAQRVEAGKLRKDPSFLWSVTIFFQSITSSRPLSAFNISCGIHSSIEKLQVKFTYFYEHCFFLYLRMNISLFGKESTMGGSLKCVESRNYKGLKQNKYFFKISFGVPISNYKEILDVHLVTHIHENHPFLL